MSNQSPSNTTPDSTPESPDQSLGQNQNALSPSNDVLPPPTPLQRQLQIAKSNIESAPTDNAGFDYRLFQRALLDCMHEGVVFVDTTGCIKAWSHSVELMTGTFEERVIDRPLVPALLNLCDMQSDPVSAADCPIATCLKMGRIVKGPYKVIGRSGREIKIELCASPVINDDNQIQGVIAQLHDASVKLDLQRQLKDLYEISVHDPLTKVANRAEFERVFDKAIETFQTNNSLKCSLIICDIDFFKSINDNYGHHIGDLALVAFASQLKQFVRSHDLVARYGGEEFVILCLDCDLESAQQRAEGMRASLERTPQKMLNGKCITASFGVAQLEVSDNATDFFVRCDSALLKAKEMGRNRVVVANGRNPANTEMKSVPSQSISGIDWREPDSGALLSEEFVTSTPTPVLVEKLRSYIFENDAEVRSVEKDFVSMEVAFEDPENYSRRGNFRVLVEIQEAAPEIPKIAGKSKKSFIRITIRAAKRKWFSTNANELAPALMTDLRVFLMINDEASAVKVEAAATRPANR
jgi:diguanylate cyclase (GGDEF)-like protein/PAS domain S-box-containing protein